MTTIQAGLTYYKQVNEKVREAAEKDDSITIENVIGQRYIGCGSSGKNITVHGTPGNGLGQYLNGSTLEVFGNAQEAVGDTMNEGDIIIHGNVGDACGYGMRGGRILVREGCGWRVGIHMKQYGDKAPAIVIGGDAGSFLGEYQAGGLILVLGLHTDGRPVVHFFPCTGMHGGKMVFRGDVSNIRFPDQVSLHSATAEDMAEIGIQVWQGVLPENDIPALQQKLHGRLVLMGGMGAAIDRTDAAPEEIYGYAMDRTYYNRFYRGPLPVSELMDHLGKPDPARYGILLAHHPAYRSSYASYGADLTLSGHYHGGVVGLGAHRGLVTPDFRLFSKNCRGLFLTGGTCQIISAGTGEHTIPVRIWNRRELIITDIGKP